MRFVFLRSESNITTFWFCMDAKFFERVVFNNFLLIDAPFILVNLILIGTIYKLSEFYSFYFSLYHILKIHFFVNLHIFFFWKIDGAAFPSLPSSWVFISFPPGGGGTNFIHPWKKLLLDKNSPVSSAKRRDRKFVILIISFMYNNNNTRRANLLFQLWKFSLCIHYTL